MIIKNINLKFILCLLFVVIIPIKAFTEDTFSIENLDEIYPLMTNWQFKAEDRSEFKNNELVTDNWNSISPFSVWQILLPEHSEYEGNVWYRLKLEIDNRQIEKRIGIFLPFSYGSSQLFLNENLIHETREFSPDGKSPYIGSKPEYVEIPEELFNQGTNILALRVSSVDGVGGFVGRIKIGPLNKIKSSSTRFLITQVSISFICLFLGFYFFIYYLTRKKEKYYLWFALLNICIGLVTLGYHGITLYIYDRHWVYALLTFLAAINIYYMILNFIHSFLNIKKGIIGKIFTIYYILSSIALIVEYAFTKQIFFFIKYEYNIFNFSYIFLLIYLVILNIKAIKAKTYYAKLFTIGIFILVSSFLLNMMIFTGKFYELTGLSIIGLVGESHFSMIIIFSIILAKRYGKTFTDLEISNDENVELNNTLEEKVKIRTAELNTANLQLTDKNTQIMDSITYASTIQQSILPQKEVLTKNIKEHFTLWRPKNVVGGDFHWFHETDKGFLLAVCDCTGHGVPGALMTMTTYSVLNRIASHFIDDNPANILKELNKVLRSLLNQNTEKSLSDDGLDMGLCYYSKEDKRVIFSGAKNSLRIVQNGKLTELKGNKQSIGYFKSKEKFEYTNHEISIEENQTFYMTTDGFLDQNGGEKDFSFGKTRFNKMVLKYADLPLPEQKAHFEKELKEYMKDESQRDDIVVLGFKV